MAPRARVMADQRSRREKVRSALKGYCFPSAVCLVCFASFYKIKRIWNFLIKTELNTISTTIQDTQTEEQAGKPKNDMSWENGRVTPRLSPWGLQGTLERSRTRQCFPALSFSSHPHPYFHTLISVLIKDWACVTTATHGMVETINWHISCARLANILQSQFETWERSFLPAHP